MICYMDKSWCDAKRCKNYGNCERMKIKACVVARKWKLGKRDKLLIWLWRNVPGPIYYDGEVWEQCGT